MKLYILLIIVGVALGFVWGYFITSKKSKEELDVKIESKEKEAV